MLALTFAPCVLTFVHYILIFAPSTRGVSLLATGADIPGDDCHPLQFALVKFFIQPLAQKLHLHFGKCTVWWYIYTVQVAIYTTNLNK